jgi:hypothetical protein
MAGPLNRRSQTIGALGSLDGKKSTAILGLTFLGFLGLAYAENIFFFQILGDVLHNVFLGVAMLFLHNVLVVSLILLGMTFYVNLVVFNFFRREKHADVVIAHPRGFALIFTFLVVILSILRGATLIQGGIDLEVLPLVLLMSAPIGIVEGYGIYMAIVKTFIRKMSTKDLIYIYTIFLIAAIMEVGFINLLIWIWKR